MKSFFTISTLVILGILLMHNQSCAQEKIIPTNQENPFNVFIDDHPVSENFEIFSINIVIKPKISFAEIKILFKGDNSDISALGKKISVMLGYHSTMEKVFHGKIVKHEIKQLSNEPLIIILKCEGISVNNKLSNTSVVTLKRGANIIEYEFEFTGHSKLKGELLVNGLAESLAGNKVELKGFGKQFDGLVLVTKVKHIVKKNNWTTRLFIELR